MAQETSEFRFLPMQAQTLNVPTPTVRRVSTRLGDDRELSALRFGDGPVGVTLVHGAGLNSHTWDSVALLLQRPALAVDLAGHGDSSWRDDRDYSPATLATDLSTAATRWTSQPQIVVGHSLGGLTAAVLAAQHPELVDSLVLVDVVPGLDVDAAPAVLRDFYAVTDFASRDEAVERAQRFGLGGSREDAERGVLFNTRMREDGRVEWKHHFAHIIADAFDALRPAPARTAADPWAALASVAAPVTLVRGSRGFLQDADVVSFRRRMPDAEVITLDAGHNVQETQAAALAQIIARAPTRTRR